MRKRLRPVYSDFEMGRIYNSPHQHSHWKDHKIRVNTTIQTAKWFDDAKSGADLSCGDGTILKSLNLEEKYFGDYAKGYEINGPIEETVEQIPRVDLFIISETIEHLDNPDLVLKKIRDKTKYLVLSTPDGEENNDNPEHYWGWDNTCIKEMLVSSGFNPVVYQAINFFQPEFFYNYQIWGCE